MAAMMKLPLVFVIEHNGYGEHTGADFVMGNDVAIRTEGFGIPVAVVDGTDFFAVEAAMQTATDRAHQGEGPSAIVAYAKRWHGHFEGDPQAYRDKAEIQALRETADPLTLFVERVLDEEHLSQTDIEAMDAEIAEEVKQAVDAALAAPSPDPSELLTDVYVSY